MAPPAIPERRRCAGAPAGLLAERVPAVRLEQRAGRSDGTRREGRLEPGDVVVEQRLQVGVDDHGRAALVLAPDRRDLVRERYGRPVVLLQQLAGGELVGRLEVREQVTDGDRGTPAVQVSARELLPQPVAVERDELPALLVQPLVDADAVAARDERRRLAPPVVVVVLARDALDERNVLEPFRRQVQHTGAGAGQHGVDADRRADHDVGDGGGVDAGGVQGGGHGVDRALRRRRHLGDRDGPGLLVDRDEVGERAPGVDADANHRRQSR